MAATVIFRLIQSLLRVMAIYWELDFHLQGESPCIDSGSAAEAPTTDLEGTTRPQGNGVDMGCYEYQLNTSVLPTISNEFK